MLVTERRMLLLLLLHRLHLLLLSLCEWREVAGALRLRCIVLPAHGGERIRGRVGRYRQTGALG